jgi:hypothetical protein
MFHSDNPIAPKIATWSNVYFSLISDIFGGAIGGVIIGSLLHFFCRSYPQEANAWAGDGGKTDRHELTPRTT